MDKLNPVLLVEPATPKFVAIIYSDDHDTFQTLANLRNHFTEVEIKEVNGSAEIHLTRHTTQHSYNKYTLTKGHAVVLLDHSVEVCSLEVLQQKYDIVGSLNDTQGGVQDNLTALSNKIADIYDTLDELKKPRRRKRTPNATTVVSSNPTTQPATPTEQPAQQQEVVFQDKQEIN